MPHKNNEIDFHSFNLKIKINILTDIAFSTYLLMLCYIKTYYQYVSFKVQTESETDIMKVIFTM